MNDLIYTRLQAHLMRLKLAHMAETLDATAQEAAKHEWTYLGFLDHLVQGEVSARSQREIALKTGRAHFPFVKTLDQFDFAFQSSVNERQLRELATMRFVAQGENLLLLGPPGVGKTHLAIALGVAAVTQALSVYFISLSDLLDLLHKDAREDRLTDRLATLCRPKLLILDEMGYFPLDRVTAQFLFQLVSRRYQKGSIILTSNKSFGDWGEIFADQILAAALLDRLLHYSTTLNLRGQSYRLREKRKSGVFTEFTEPHQEVALST